VIENFEIEGSSIECSLPGFCSTCANPRSGPASGWLCGRGPQTTAKTSRGSRLTANPKAARAP